LLQDAFPAAVEIVVVAEFDAVVDGEGVAGFVDELLGLELLDSHEFAISPAFVGIEAGVVLLCDVQLLVQRVHQLDLVQVEVD
jgi:hypothetical protein